VCEYTKEEIVKNGTQEMNSGWWEKKPASNPKDRPTRITSGKRSDQARVPTSVALTVDECNALKLMAIKRKVSKSDLLRHGVRHVLASDPNIAPPSIGIVDGVYGATIHDDVVALANSLASLSYVVGLLEQHISRGRRQHARAMLCDTIGQLEAVAGRLSC
jgi:hypothetical protein